MATRLTALLFDAADPPRIGRWWADALGWQFRVDDWGDAVLSPPTDAPDPDVHIEFLDVSELKVVKNRIHLDLASDSVEGQRATVERFIAA